MYCPSESTADYRCQPLSSSDGAQSLQLQAQPDTFGVFLTGGLRQPKW